MSSARCETVVLVVEDEMLVRMHGVGILEDAGFKVLEAANADEALAILDKHDDVRLLFSDVDMPGTMDGLELVRLVHNRWPAIRLLLTSGHRHLKNDSLPDNGEFVRKPWSESVLIQKVQSVLEPASSN
ncbi:response regulator [Sphingomonas asaccharolytica]|uniref:response regulator n=1 Tax=Sphingomonas asaccharolytica TaxID=40681 RepID=UPI00082A9545|nr:response regulator [Sphingomonas asaccharolytica]